MSLFLEHASQVGNNPILQRRANRGASLKPSKTLSYHDMDQLVAISVMWGVGVSDISPGETFVKAMCHSAVSDFSSLLEFQSPSTL
jgi:hypothetical protein